jgi:uncharacterized Zn-binding protein involved in type VI secretion
MDEKQTGLSEFFSVLSKEKVKTKKDFQDKLENPASDLVNLFAQLENALTETKKISETPSIQEVTEEKILSSDDQNKLEVFSNLMGSFSSLEKSPSEVKDDFIEVVQDVLPVDEEIEDVKEVDEIPEEIVKTDNIIDEIVSTLDEMGEKTEVKEEIDQISALRRDFNNFKNLIQRDISNQKMSGAGSGEVRLEFLDDVQKSTAKVDGKVLQYSSSDNKWVGENPVGISELLEETDGDNIVYNATDASGSNEDDDVLLEAGVDGSRDIDQFVLQILTTNIIPQQGEKFSLGSPSHRFKSIYLGSETIDIGGATISSDGSGTITISADGATLPVGTKDADGFKMQIGSETQAAAGQAIRLVKFFTQASGLSTAAATFKFNASLDNRSVYRAEGHTFVLNDGSTSSDGGTELFQF